MSTRDPRDAVEGLRERPLARLVVDLDDRLAVTLVDRDVDVGVRVESELAQVDCLPCAGCL